MRRRIKITWKLLKWMYAKHGPFPCSMGLGVFAGAWIASKHLVDDEADKCV